jgi:enoyl-CoA hydratase/carnithine racemase
MTEILFAIADHIATLTIDRPNKLNAMTPAMIAALQAHAKAIAAFCIYRAQKKNKGNDQQINQIHSWK